jgi:hypothetical protein
LIYYGLIDYVSPFSLFKNFEPANKKETTDEINYQWHNTILSFLAGMFQCLLHGKSESLNKATL